MLIDNFNQEYADWLKTLKTKIIGVQQKAVLAVNQELIGLYWHIGEEILQRQRKQGWGAKIVEQLSNDLRVAFPEMKGFSTRNLKYMRKFATAFQQFEIVQQTAAQLPWFHICTILDKTDNLEQHIWYMRQAIENGWSRNVLVHQIESKLMEREGKAVTNFSQNLPNPMSELA